MPTTTCWRTVVVAAASSRCGSRLRTAPGCGRAVTTATSEARHTDTSRRARPRWRTPTCRGHLGRGLFLWLNELATRLHLAKYAVRGKAVAVAKLAYRRRIDSRITD